MMSREPIHAPLHHDTNFDGSFRRELTRGILTDLPDIKVRISSDPNGEKVFWESSAEELIFRTPLPDSDQIAVELIIMPDVVQLPIGTSYLDFFLLYPGGGMVQTRQMLRRQSTSERPASLSQGGPTIIHRDTRPLLPGAQSVTIYWPSYLQEAGGRTAALRLLDPNGVPDSERVLKLLENTHQFFTIGFEPSIPDEEGWTLLWIG